MTTYLIALNLHTKLAAQSLSSVMQTFHRVEAARARRWFTEANISLTSGVVTDRATQVDYRVFTVVE